MKKMTWIFAFAFLLAAVISSICWAMDFENMSNEDLFELHGAIQNAPEQDKTAYQAEWDKRLAGMTEEEKKQFEDREQAEKTADGELKPPVTQAKGYETKGVQGQIIFGGFPEKGNINY